MIIQYILVCTISLGIIPTMMSQHCDYLLYYLSVIPRHLIIFLNSCTVQILLCESVLNGKYYPSYILEMMYSEKRLT